jgi:hypothetical protein
VETRTVRNRKAAALPRASGFAAVPSGDRLAGVAKSQVATHALARLRQRSVADTTGTAVVPLPLIVIRLIDSFRTTRVFRAIGTVGTIRTAGPAHHRAQRDRSSASGAGAGASSQDCRCQRAPAVAILPDAALLPKNATLTVMSILMNGRARVRLRPTRARAINATLRLGGPGLTADRPLAWSFAFVYLGSRRIRARIPQCPDVSSPAAQASSAAI